jgi:2',3'-cyclic-nucleotide 2'-phosphodiesterase (5'-nucleotidase family)
MKPWVHSHSTRPALMVAALLLCSTVAGFADTIKSDVELTTKEIGAKEAVIGDIVADAIRASAKADAAFIAATSFSDTVALPKGNVNTSEIVDSLVYKSENIVIVKLTGDQITKAFEQSLFLFPKSNSAFLQFSGLTVTVKPDGDAGKRVASIKTDAGDIDPKKTYKIAMPAPLANGGLAYFKIWQKTAIDKETDVTVEAALNSWFTDHKTVTKGDERLVTHR